MFYATNANPQISAGELNPLVSVVISTHNRSKLVCCAIDSVLRQTYANLEILVVDDASTDNTQTAVERFSDPRIRYIRHAQNLGGSATRNTGIRAATGQYIAFLDDDDAWEPDKTRSQLEVLERYDIVLCTSDQEIAKLKHNAKKETVDLEDLRRGAFTAGGTGILMARRNILLETMFDESLPKYQDWDLFIRIAMRHRIGYVNEPLVRYNSGAHDRITNSTSRLKTTEAERQVRMLEKHREFFGEKWFKRHMSRAMLYGIKYRANKIEHILYTVRKYGVVNFMRATTKQMRIKLNKGIRRFETAVTGRSSL